MVPDDHAMVPANGARRDLRPLLAPAVDRAEQGDGPDDQARAADGPWTGTNTDETGTPRDYPTPRAVRHRAAFDWYEDRYPVDNFAGLGRQLAQAGDLFRNTTYGGGLLLASPVPHVPPIQVTDAAALDAIIADRQRVRVIKAGNVKGGTVPSRYLRTMLASEAFLQQFRPVDVVGRASKYLPDFTITRPGYNDGGYGQRVLHIGDAPWVEFDLDATIRFLDVMDFATEADRTNAVAAALTVLLRNHWPGGKPCLIVTSSKSHGGKETIVAFAAGPVRHVSVSYERADWALQKALVAALKQEPDIGLVDVENARLDRGQEEIRSAFLERFLTDPEPLLYSPGTGRPVRRPNDIVVALTTNFGAVCEDLHNRGLPIHLDPVGDVADRRSPIGNPKLEYLPANRDRIEAELRGMVERWKREGSPLDPAARHPSGPWAAVIGGILMVNGFAAFLGNCALRRTADDPVRRGLGLLGAARPDEWLRSGDWAALARGLGLVKAVVPQGDRDTDLGQERGVGVVLSAHRGETYSVETEDRHLVVRLEKARRRFDEGEEPQTRYRFARLRAEEIPEDPE